MVVVHNTGCLCFCQNSYKALPFGSLWEFYLEYSSGLGPLVPPTTPISYDSLLTFIY